MASRLADTILDDAKSNAQRRGHREVQIEHLLSSLLAQPTLTRELSIRGLSVALLGEKLETELARIPESVGYRDGTHAIAIAPATHALVSRHAGWRSVLHGASMGAIIDALLVHPIIARLLPACRFDATAIHDLHVASVMMMVKLRQRTLMLEHALMALTQDERFAAALTRMGHAPTSVRESLEALVKPGYRSARLAPAEQLARAGVVKANLARRRSLTTEFLVVDLLRNELADTSMNALKIDRFELLFTYVHGVRPTALPREGEVSIVLYDDDFTTMEIVVAVLTDTIGLTQQDATTLMLDIHRKGKAEVLRMNAADAIAKITDARAFCREEGMPLRMELIPVDA